MAKNLGLKDEFDKERKILENSLKMYEKTLAEMPEKDEKRREVISDMMEDVKKQIAELENASKLPVDKMRDKADEIVGKKLMESFMFGRMPEEFGVFEPLSMNRFLVEFNDEQVKPYYVEALWHDDGTLFIKFRNNAEFFAPLYFQEKGKSIKNKTLEVSILSPDGMKAYKMVFTGLTFKFVANPYFDYTSDATLLTDAMFSYKEVRYEANETTSKEERKNP